MEPSSGALWAASPMSAGAHTEPGIRSVYREVPRFLLPRLTTTHPAASRPLMFLETWRL